jgi:long-chain fatty acid transport protein
MISKRLLPVLRTLAFVCSTVVGVKAVKAGGFAIAEQTANGVGMGNAITAGVEDPSATYINPAALVEIPGNQIMSGLNYVNTHSRVKNSGLTSKNVHDDDFLPNLFANYHIPGTQLTLGIGSYTPFGLTTTYDESSFTRFAAIRSELKTIYVTPSIAWRPTPYLSVGGGLSFVHSSALLSRALFLGAVGVGEGRLRITGTDNAYGYNVGVIIKPHDQIKVGFTYRSRVALEFDQANVKFIDAAFAGGALTNTKASGVGVPIPAVINTGIQWQITPIWKVELDYNFTRWSEFKHLKARFNSPLPALGGAVLIPGFLLPQDWKDSSTIRAGTAYKPTDNVELRAGLSLDQTPIPDRTLNPAIPGANILTLNSGIGYSWNRVNLDLSYMAIFYQSRRVSNNSLETGNNPAALPFPGVPGRDKYEIFQNFVALNLRYRF